jgi:hypothetical protein
MSRQDQYNVTVSIAGSNLGTFDKMSGGEFDSEETKYKPGAMAPQISLGGSQTVSNIVLKRLYVLERDHTIINWLKSQVGKGEVVVTKQPLDINEHPYGSPIVYQGKLKKVMPPPADSEATTTPAELELEVSTAGIVT